jgi:hypothetical protein
MGKSQTQERRTMVNKHTQNDPRGTGDNSLTRNYVHSYSARVGDKTVSMKGGYVTITKE